MNRETMLLRPDLTALFTALPPGPEGFTLALLAETRLVAEFVCGATGTGGPGPETLAWMIMELVSNSISSALGSALGRATGLSRERMLQVFGTSVIWPGEEAIRSPGGTEEDERKLEEALGMGIGAWLDLPALEKFRNLGLLPGEGWVTVHALSDPERMSISVSVRSSHLPLAGDMEVIRHILGSPENSKREILELRKRHTCSSGMYHIPSFTGGGGMGLLECARLSAEHGLELTWESPGMDGTGMEFVLGRNAIKFA